MIAAMEKTMGHVTDSASMVGIARQQHYQWIKDDPEYAMAIDMVGEATVDFAESKLRELISGITMAKEAMDGIQVYETGPNVAAVIFFLKCKAKKRGYIEKSELDITGTPINITISDKI